MINKGNIEISVKLIGACIALFGVWAFFDDRALIRKENASQRALAYVEKFESDTLVEARTSLFEFWVGKENIIAAISNADGISDGEYNNFIQISYDAYNNKTGLTEALMKLENFYSQVNFCIAYELCNERLITDYFCPRISAFDNAYTPFFQHIGKQYEFRDLGYSVVELSEVCSSRTHR